MAKLTHIDKQGAARMVDVGGKKVTRRRAVASGRVLMKAETAAAIKAGLVKKGDVLAAARIAGILAAKKTAELVPLAHPLGLDHVAVEFEVKQDMVEIRAQASVRGRTGVEMEALCAVAGAALCIYDMAKAIDRGMVISDIRVDQKSGGRSGTWKRD
ncbi:MAG TPA: cyclic pyranopterin monophosphate synthase MoaC [bacterium]|nr:cyclic pyranopterin monophosphate synthase MoaC [bacterium]